MSSKISWSLGILAASLLLGGGLWVWMTQVTGDKQPVIQSLELHPSELRFSGGQVTVRATVMDDVGVRQVWGALWRQDGALSQMPAMRPTGLPREVTYDAGIQAPPNIRPGGAPLDYSVRLVAVDSAGQESVDTITLRVWPPDAPPEPPQ